VRKKELQARLDEMRQLLGQLERHSDRISTVLMVREPATSDAADAYEGLRRQVVNAFAERRSHLSQLVQLDDALSRGADARTLAAMVASWLEQASLRRVQDFTGPGRRELFDVLGDPGDHMEVVAPAYVDDLTGRPVRLGRIQAAVTPQRLPQPTPTPEAEPVPERLAAALPGADGDADGPNASGEEQA